MHLFCSCSALTLEDEKRSLALLIVGFIRMVSLLRMLFFLNLLLVNAQKQIGLSLFHFRFIIFILN